MTAPVWGKRKIVDCLRGSGLLDAVGDRMGCFTLDVFGLRCRGVAKSIKQSSGRLPPRFADGAILVRFLTVVRLESWIEASKSKSKFTVYFIHVHVTFTSET